MMLVELLESLEVILEKELIDWLDEDQRHLIVLEAEELGISDAEGLASHLFFDSKVFKDSLEESC